MPTHYGDAGVRPRTNAHAYGAGKRRHGMMNPERQQKFQSMMEKLPKNSLQRLEMMGPGGGGMKQRGRRRRMTGLMPGRGM